MAPLAGIQKSALNRAAQLVGTAARSAASVGPAVAWRGGTGPQRGVHVGLHLGQRDGAGGQAAVGERMLS